MSTVVMLGPRDHGRPLSVEEFESARWQEGYKYELISGRLYVSPLPDLPHDQIVRWINRVLDDYARARPEVINYVIPQARVFVPRRLPASSPACVSAPSQKGRCAWWCSSNPRSRRTAPGERGPTGGC